MARGPRGHVPPSDYESDGAEGNPFLQGGARSVNGSKCERKHLPDKGAPRRGASFNFLTIWSIEDVVKKQRFNNNDGKIKGNLESDCPNPKELKKSPYKSKFLSWERDCDKKSSHRRK